MKRKPILWYCLVMVFLTNMAMVDMGVGQNSARIYVDPEEIEGVNPCCDPFDIEIRIEDVEDLYAYGFTLSYAPYASVLVPIVVTEEPFLQQGGTTFFAYSINPFEGSILIGCTLLPPVEQGVSGSGTLVTVKFRAVEAGESNLELSDTDLINSRYEFIVHDVDHGYYKGPRAEIVSTDYKYEVKVSEEQTFNATVRKRSESCEHEPEEPPLWTCVMFQMVRIEDHRLSIVITDKIYIDTGQEVDLPPVTWLPTEADIGTYICTATVYFSYHDALFNFGRRVITFIFIVYEN